MSTSYRLYFQTEENIYNLKVPAASLGAAKKVAQARLAELLGSAPSYRKILTGHVVIEGGKEVWKR